MSQDLSEMKAWFRDDLARLIRGLLVSGAAADGDVRKGMELFAVSLSTSLGVPFSYLSDVITSIPTVGVREGLDGRRVPVLGDT